MKPTERQRLRSLDDRLRRLRNLAVHAQPPPKGGWVATLRQALGLTAGKLGERLDISSQAISQLERAERTGAISLAKLRELAREMDAEFVYAIVPRTTIKKTLEDRARALATKRLATVARSMHLEQQGVSPKELEAQIEDLAQELLNRPRELWR